MNDDNGQPYIYCNNLILRLDKKRFGRKNEKKMCMVGNPKFFRWQPYINLACVNEGER